MQITKEVEAARKALTAPIAGPPLPLVSLLSGMQSPP